MSIILILWIGQLGFRDLNNLPENKSNHVSDLSRNISNKGRIVVIADIVNVLNATEQYTLNG